MKKSKQPSVLLGLSGGVDSSLAAILLQKRGYKVYGAFIKSFSNKSSKLPGKCLWKEDIKYAKKISKILGIFLIKYNFEREYMNEVIEPMFKSYSKGLTPNPDSLCNKKIKFPLLWKQAKKMGINYIATGHYIKKFTNSDGSYSIKIPKDKTKDQSYFLYDLTQSDLKHTLFPIGDENITKEDVRKLAKVHNLPNYNKPGTRGLCFIGKTDMKKLLMSKIKPLKGKLLDPDGNIIGHHNGIMFYTIGERFRDKFGITIDKSYRHKHGKLYIAQKDKKRNTITIAPDNHPILLRKIFQIIKVNIINKKIKLPSACNVRIRHLGKLHLVKIKKSNNQISCSLKHPIKDLAEGQSAVLYEQKTNVLICGGEIRFK